MPILKSAKKALRQDKKRRLLNLGRLRAMRHAIKAVRQAPQLQGQVVGSMSGEELKQLLNAAYQALDKGAKTGIIKKNTAARKKSRLALHLQKKVQGKLKTESATPPQPPEDQKPPQAQPVQS